MKRLVLIVTSLLLFHSAAFAIGPAYSGSWYNPAQSGHGFSLEYSVLDDETPLIVAYWYVYDSEGNPIYLIGVGVGFVVFCVCVVFEAPYGMKFGEFDPDSTIRADGGTGVFAFEDSETGVFNYQPSQWMIDTYGVSAISIPVVQLLEVAHPNDEPPSGEPVPLVGLWSGRMVYDRSYVGTATCYDADVLISVIESYQGIIFTALTVDRDGGGVSSTSSVGGHIRNNYVTGGFYTFSIFTEYSLRFDNYGQAEGTWSQERFDDCYGTWEFTKD
jgi:hypothetical protein